MKNPTKILIAAGLLASLALPTFAGGPKHHPRHHKSKSHSHSYERGAFRLGLGLVTPEGESDLWTSNALNFTGSPEDHEDLSISGELLYSLNRFASVSVGASAFEGETTQASRDFVDEFGDDIVHLSTLRTAPLTVGLTLYPFGRNASIVPYVGAGAGFYFWEYEQAGDFVEFDGIGDPIGIVSTQFLDDGVTTGHYLQAGLSLPVADTWSIWAEGRWHDADDNLSDGPPSTIDLSAKDYRAGISWSF